MCVVLAASVGSARAATPGLSYGYVGDIGGTAAAPTNPITVDQSGTVYIARSGEIEVLDPDGTVLAHAVGEGLLGPETPASVAVAPDGSALYMTSNAAEFWEYIYGRGSFPALKLLSDGASPPTYTKDLTWTTGSDWPGRFMKGIAVDPSTGDLVIASSGDGEFEAGIYRVDASTGAVLSSFDGATTKVGKFAAPASIAVAPNGDTYVIEKEPNRVEHMGADGSWKGSLPLNYPAGNNSLYIPHGIAVDPQNGDVAVLQPASTATLYNEPVINIYSSTNALKETILLPPGLMPPESGTGLAFSPDGNRLYLADRSGPVHVLTRGTQPGLDSPSASGFTPDGALLTAVVATGGEPTAAHIEYCLASEPCGEYLSSNGLSPWRALPEHTGLAGPGQDEISDQVTGLLPNARYLSRSYAVNESTQVRKISATSSFTTAIAPPSVVTQGATGITATGATLNGTVNPEGAPSTYFFEYGPTSSYGSRIPLTEAAAGDGRTPHSFSVTLTGLSPGATVHFRIVGRNAGGTTPGEDAEFNTAAALPPGRAYEQVTPVDQDGGNLNGLYGVEALPDAEALTYLTTPIGGDAESAPKEGRVLSIRGSSDWGAQLHVDPPFIARTGLNLALTAAVSDDGTHAFVLSNHALAPGAGEGRELMNLYVKDLRDGTYAFVGTANGLQNANALTNDGRHLVVEASPDFSWIVFSTAASLLPGVREGQSTGGFVTLYRWRAAGGLEVESVTSEPILTQKYRGAEFLSMRQVSEDGRRVFFQAHDSGVVYLREGGHSRPISVSRIDDSAQPGELFGCSSSGRFVFFESGKLIASAPEGERSLYRYDVESGELEYIPGASNLDFGGVAGISEDGSTIYFVSGPGGGETKMWRNGVLATVPAPVGGPVPAYKLLQISPNGQYAGIAWSGDVYRYDAEAQALRCVSCSAGSPTGLAGVPTGTGYEMVGTYHAPQWVDDDGTVYFTTSATLVPSDVNGVGDVYAYEGGHQHLISPGDGPYSALLLTISTGGRDVYFLTNQPLVARDTNKGSDIYDARIGGGFAVQNQIPPPPCAGEACQPPALPSPAAGGTASEATTPAAAARTHSKKKHPKRSKCKAKSGSAKARSKKSCHSKPSKCKAKSASAKARSKKSCQKHHSHAKAKKKRSPGAGGSR